MFEIDKFSVPWMHGHVDGVWYDAALGCDGGGSLQLLHESHDVEHHLGRYHLVLVKGE